MRHFLWLLLFAPAVTYGQSAVSFQFDPPVIAPGKTATVLLQIQVAGSPSRVTYESTQQPGGEVDMKDDGTGGDRTAGDSVYTIALATGPMVSAMQADDVHRPFVGRFYLYNGATRVVTGGVGAEIADSTIPPMPVTKDDDDVQHTDYVVNILMPTAFPLSSQNAIVNRFYEIFPDDFDVIDVVYIPSFFLNRFHYAVRNAVSGIGRSQFDNGVAYGSPSRLKGISVFPISYLFDGAEESFQHEFGHQWINYLNASPVASAIPHWPMSTMATGIMGFNGPGGVGGDFSCVITSDASGVYLNPRTAPIVFSDMDLYLMGLLPPDQVGEQIVLDQPVPNHCTATNQYTGPVTRFQVADLIANAAVGPRVPSAATAQKEFRLGTILVTRDALLDADAMAFYSLFAQRAELQVPVAVHRSVTVKSTAYPFALSTRGLGTMKAGITVKKRRGQLISQ